MRQQFRFQMTKNRYKQFNIIIVIQEGSEAFFQYPPLHSLWYYTQNLSILTAGKTAGYWDNYNTYIGGREVLVGMNYAVNIKDIYVGIFLGGGEFATPVLKTKVFCVEKNDIVTHVICYCYYHIVSIHTISERYILFYNNINLIG